MGATYNNIAMNLTTSKLTKYLQWGHE